MKKELPNDLQIIHYWIAYLQTEDRRQATMKSVTPLKFVMEISIKKIGYYSDSKIVYYLVWLADSAIWQIPANGIKYLLFQYVQREKLGLIGFEYQFFL